MVSLLKVVSFTRILLGLFAVPLRIRPRTRIKQAHETQHDVIVMRRDVLKH